MPSSSHHLTAGLILAGLLSACSPTPTPAPAVPQPIVQGQQLRFPADHPQLALLNTTEVVAASTVQLDMPAKLVWNEERTQRIYPAFAGRVSAIRADLGQNVKAGQVLAQLASPEFGAAQADAAKAQADSTLAERTLQRQRELLDAGIVARKDFEQAQADAARAQAELARASSRTQLYGHATGVNQQLALTAGIAGVVVERNINPGQEVRPDQSGPGMPALFTVTDPSVLWVLIDARESESATLRPGAPFELHIASLPGLLVKGQVAAVADTIDPNTRTIKVRGVVANPTRVLKAEMLATAHTEKRVSQGVVVPAGAVTLQGARHQVFVQTAPGVFESRAVTVMLEGPSEVVLSEGVKKGERVVSQNALLLTRLLNIAQDEARTATGATAGTPASAAASTPGSAR